jgi:hypothetical protein
VVTSKFSNPLTLTLEVEAWTVRLGEAKTAIAEAMRTTREAQREQDIGNASSEGGWRNDLNEALGKRGWIK